MNYALYVKILKALADENRLRIVQMLDGQELCGCHILDEVPITQPTLSHHMRVLTDVGIVKSNKIGKHQHYSLDLEQGEDFADFIRLLFIDGGQHA